MSTKKGQSTQKTLANQQKKVYVDFSAPANDAVFDGDAYVQYLKEHIKVDNKAGNLGDKITVTKEGDGKVLVTATGAFSKRYVKYLTKRFLKKNSMRDWLRVVATKKDSFTLRYFNVSTEAADDVDDAGGTIACSVSSNLEVTAYGDKKTPGFTRLSGKDILDRVPEISNIAQVAGVVEVKTQQYDTAEYLRLARLIKTIDTPVVITRGTNDIAELAFFLDVTLDRKLPVVVTGSMRPISGLSADSQYNLVQAFSLAGSEAAQGRGVLVTLGDRITSGYYCNKVSANRLDTFQGFEVGQLGFFVNWIPQFFFEPAKPLKKPLFDFVIDNESITKLPKIGIIWSHLDQRRDAIKKEIEAGIDGLVFAVWAAGGFAVDEWQQELVDLAGKGTPVVRSSASPYGFITPIMSLEEDKQVAAGHLPPNKALIVLEL
ncbi:hypothetical protein EMMF5_005376, partial [Cystobasidiomycetes sp. EMM_F5]